jgi:hypothetical protein
MMKEVRPGGKYEYRNGERWRSMRKLRRRKWMRETRRRKNK